MKTKIKEQRKKGIAVQSVVTPKTKRDINVWYAKFTPWHYEQLIQD